MLSKRKKLENLCKEKGYNIYKKESSILMKVLSILLFFVKDFMNKFSTTIGKNIYLTKEVYKNDKLFLQVVTHEMIHAYDGSRITPFFYSLLYLSPQVFALLAIPLAFVNLWFLLLLLLILPIPSPFRYWAEIRGYTGSMASMYWMNFIIPYDWFSSHFTNGNYYWMWPFKNAVKNKLKRNMEKIKNESIFEEIPLLKEVKEKVFD